MRVGWESRFVNRSIVDASSAGRRRRRARRRAWRWGCRRRDRSGGGHDEWDLDAVGRLLPGPVIAGSQLIFTRRNRLRQRLRLGQQRFRVRRLAVNLDPARWIRAVSGGVNDYEQRVAWRKA